MRPPVTFTVLGKPAGQGSKRHVGNGVMVESSKAVKPWRQDVSAAAVEAMDGRAPYAGPLALHVTFVFARPKSHYGTGLRAGRVKDSAPSLKATMPDIDKLLRSTFDALTVAGVWQDDAQVAHVDAMKTWGNHSGATITVEEAT